VYSIWVEVGVVADVGGQGKHSGLLVLHLLLYERGDCSLGIGVPGRGGSRSSGGQIKLDSRIGLADSAKIKTKEMQTTAMMASPPYLA
jgi:hypothetical protein